MAPTIRFNVLTLSSFLVGLITTSPSINPTLTAPTGPFHGISDSASAAEAKTKY